MLQAREAVSQLASMARLGVQPDTQAATALIYACARNGNMEMAQAAFEELFGAPSSPGCLCRSGLQSPQPSSARPAAIEDGCEVASTCARDLLTAGDTTCGLPVR